MTRRLLFQRCAALALAGAALCCSPGKEAARLDRSDLGLAPATAGHPGGATLHQTWVTLPGDAGHADVWLLETNTEAWATRWKLISEAKTSIDAAYFIIRPDPIGLAFLGLLRRKAMEGVKVRLLLDARGSTALATPFGSLDYLHELIEQGDVQVKIFNPVASRIPDALLRLSAIPVAASSHQKLLIVDREVAITGGRNIDTQYFADWRDYPSAWMDAEVLLRGPTSIVKLESTFASELEGGRAMEVLKDLVDITPRHDVLGLHAAAMDIWLARPQVTPAEARALREDHTRVRNLALALEAEAVERLGHEPSTAVRREFRELSSDLVRLPLLRGVKPVSGPPDAAGAEVRVLYKPTQLGKRKNTITPSLNALSMAAAEEIVIETPYLVLTMPLLEELKLVAARGVRITILTNGPGVSDNDVGSALFIDEWPEILARVPTMRLFAVEGTRPLHAKRVVFDGEMTVIGTYNLDPLSEAVNSELAAVIHAPFFAAKNLRLMSARQSRPNVYEYKIARDQAGAPLRDGAGKVVRVFGPEDHTKPERIAQLRQMKERLLRIQGFFDFEPAVW